MGFFVRHAGRDYPLSPGRFSIGRSESSDLCLDDPLASRNHAEIHVEGSALRLDDLQSRNGILVNDERVQGSLTVGHGDRIRIGGQELIVLQRSPGRAETLAQSPITQRLQAFGVLGALADKALTMGNGNEAERILGRQLEQLLEQAEKEGALEDGLFEKMVSYALRLATLTRKAKWLDYLFRLHAALKLVMEADLVNELYVLSRKITGASRAHLRAYLAVLHDNAANLNPSERFVLGRLEGLEALLN